MDRLIRARRGDDEMTDKPIPDLVVAFREAVDKFFDWTGGEEPPLFLRGNKVSIGHLCGLIGEYHDPLPESLISKLLSQGASKRAQEELWRHRTYAAGARCLLSRWKGKKARYDTVRDA
jgi:hypothetical protein